MQPFTPSWYTVLASYWFATSFKWAAVLLALLPERVAQLVANEQKAGALGLLFATGAVMALIGPPLTGYFSDRFGRRMPFLAIGAVLTAVALVWMAHAPSYAVLFAAYILLQIADDLGTGPYSALIPDLVPRSKRGTASGYLGTMQMVGNIVAAVLIFSLPSIAGQFYVLAGVNLLAALLILRTIQEVPGLRQRQLGFVQSMLAPWRNPDFRWVWATRFFAMLGQYSVQTYLLYYLSDVVRTFDAFGLRLADATQAVGVLGLMIFVGGALSAVYAGRRSDQLGRKRPIYISGVGLSLVVLPILLLPRFDLLVVLALVFGVFFGVYLAVDWALVADVLPDPEGYATDMGLWQTSIVLPQVIAGSFGGLIDRANQASAGSGYTLVFLMAAGFFLLGTLLVRQIRGAR
ncbi:MULTISPECIES: MFS transporter [unclassified Meiothermus]|uniref:MFS transporter n=1 Tax=unclassified Meiothermus TaxID=370471 RepID=UPI000D7C73B3|nr:MULTISPECIES: MFS transporter [unclassified Meiothermus]PZA07136.1 MFS transporter [Meiothermus sp. Pnk-1]RYM39982.1 MFS transporter [Meiothermus sp. PNK-Is4]